MPSASAVRRQIEDALAARIPSALTPSLRPPLPVAETGIRSIDQYLEGGFPIGAITELVGPECSGRTSLAFAFLAQRTQSGMSCAWIDVSGSFHPESAAASGIELKRLLWVRCSKPSSGFDPRSNPPRKSVDVKQYKIPPVTLKGLHGGGCGGHPRSEVRGLSRAVNQLLKPGADTGLVAEHRSLDQDERTPIPCNIASQYPLPSSQSSRSTRDNSPMVRLDRALRVADLLLQAGGFTSIVIDAGSVLPEHISRVPLATWFRYRAASERTQTSLLLLTQHPSCKSSAELVLNFIPGKALLQEPTVLAGIQYRLSVTRGKTCQDQTRVIAIKSPRPSEGSASWKSYASWGTYREAIP
jgi:recombination protein RecA